MPNNLANFPKVTLGRRGLSDAGFSRWTACAIVHLDDAIGFVADVETGDAQEDTIADATDEQHHSITEALAGIWSAWTELRDFVPPSAPPTTPDAIEPPTGQELVIPQGKAGLYVASEFLGLLAAVGRVEAVCMAIARQLDATSKGAPTT